MSPNFLFVVAVFTAFLGVIVALAARRRGTRITHITTTHDQSESSGE